MLGPPVFGAKIFRSPLKGGLLPCKYYFDQLDKSVGSLKFGYLSLVQIGGDHIAMSPYSILLLSGHDIKKIREWMMGIKTISFTRNTRVLSWAILFKELVIKIDNKQELETAKCFLLLTPSLVEKVGF